MAMHPPSLYHLQNQNPHLNHKYLQVFVIQMSNTSCYAWKYICLRGSVGVKDTPSMIIPSLRLDWVMKSNEMSIKNENYLE